MVSVSVTCVRSTPRAARPSMIWVCFVVGCWKVRTVRSAAMKPRASRCSSVWKAREKPRTPVSDPRRRQPRGSRRESVPTTRAFRAMRSWRPYGMGRASLQSAWLTDSTRTSSSLTTRPSRSVITRSACAASAASCVTSTRVAPSLRFNSSSNSSTCCPSCHPDCPWARPPAVSEAW